MMISGLLSCIGLIICACATNTHTLLAGLVLIGELSHNLKMLIKHNYVNLLFSIEATSSRKLCSSAGCLLGDTQM